MFPYKVVPFVSNTPMQMVLPPLETVLKFSSVGLSTLWLQLWMLLMSQNNILIGCSRSLGRYKSHMGTELGNTGTMEPTQCSWRSLSAINQI